MEGTQHPQQPTMSRWPSVFALLFLIAALVLTFVVTSVVSARIRRQADQTFTNETDRLGEAVSLNFLSYLDVMSGLVGLFGSSEFGVTRHEWQDYVEGLSLQARLPGVTAIEFVQRVTTEQKSAFTVSVRSDTSRDAGGYPDFNIRPPGDRAEYYVGNFVEPMEDNLALFGFDALSDPDQRIAIERARDLAALTTTGRISLPSENPGITLFLPVYQGARSPQDVTVRREEIRGVVAVTMNAQIMLADIFQAAGDYDPLKQLDIEVHDGALLNRGIAESLLYHRAAALPIDPDRLRMQTLTVQFAGHPFIIITRADRSFGIGSQESYQPLLIAVSGTLLSLAAFIIVYYADVSRRRTRSLGQRMAAELQERTGELAEKNRTLEDVVSARTAALAQKVQESEESKSAILNVLDDLTVAKDQLETARAYDAALVASIADGLIAIDPDGLITAVNEATLRMLGRHREELIGRPVFSAITMVDKDEKVVQSSDRPLMRALVATPGQVFTDSSHYFIRADGIAFPIALDSAPIIMNGRVQGAIGIFRDITREKEIDRAKSEFVSLASHQLRTPLTAIGWYAELMLGESEVELSKEQRGYLNEISEANRRMVDLVDSLLNVSQIELGTLKVKTEPTQIVPLIRRVLTEFGSLIKERQVRIEEHYSDETGAVLADPRLFAVIVENLISNGIKYTPPGGTITISVELDGELIFTVADTGIGIPAMQQAKIFEKLFRADNARLSDTDGSGLGLYLVKQIVKRLGGAITFTSKEGTGTTFVVRLPKEAVRGVASESEHAS